MPLASSNASIGYNRAEGTLNETINWPSTLPLPMPNETSSLQPELSETHSNFSLPLMHPDTGPNGTGQLHLS